MKKVSGSEGYDSRKVNRGTGYYVDGNTVRRVEEVPQRKKKQVSTAAQKNRARNMQMSRKKAIEELGMKFPTEDQIKYYTPGGSSYVRQYQDVPHK